MTYSGPYCLNGSAYFAAFDRIKAHVKEFAPHLIILQGPFIFSEYHQKSKDICNESRDGTVKEYLVYDSARFLNFKKLIDEISNSRTKVLILPDSTEEDAAFPIPQPKSSLDSLAKLEIGTGGIQAGVELGTNPILFKVDNKVKKIFY